MKRTFRIVESRRLFEVSDAEAHEYATTQAVPPSDVVELVKAARESIKKDDLHADGFGPDPHITVLYGLDDVDKDRALEVMRAHGPCRAKVSGVDLFQNDDQDVVLFAVDSEDLAKLHDALDKAIPENGNRWPEYKPHMTVAYVLPGRGEAYKGLVSDLVGREFDLDALEFSDTQGKVDRVDLRGDGEEKVEEDTPLFGADILEEMDEGMRKALYPILNRSNRRVVSAKDDGSGTSVLLDDGTNLMVNRGPDTTPRESWLIVHGGEQFDTAKLGDIEKLVKRLNSKMTEQEGEADEPEGYGWKSYDPRERVPGEDEPPEPRADADAPPEKAKLEPAPPSIDEVKIIPYTSSSFMLVAERDTVGTVATLMQHQFGQPERKVAEVYKSGNDSVIVSVNEPFLSQLGVQRIGQSAASTLRKKGFTVKAFGGFGAQRQKKAAPAASAAPSASAARGPVQKPLVTIANHGYNMYLTVSIPSAARAALRGRDVIGDLVNLLNSRVMTIKSEDMPMDPINKNERVKPFAQATASSIEVRLPNTGAYKNPRVFHQLTEEILGVLDAFMKDYDAVSEVKVPRSTFGQRIMGRGPLGLDVWQTVWGEKVPKESVDDGVSEDTYTSDVSFTDTIPITRGRRRKVKLPGLTGAATRRKVKRSYKVKESMSKGTSPILVVLRPQQVAALDKKPVWSALRESGVIEARPFKMGEEPFVEVRIDTLRKEWTQANAGVLLDEVGSIDPRVQRAVMEGVPAEELAKIMHLRLEGLCRSVPVDVAIKESESFAASHRLARLQGLTTDEKWAVEVLPRDAGVVRRVLEWYDLSRDVLSRLAAIDRSHQHQDGAFCEASKRAARKLLEDETTDTGANLGAMADPSGNPAGGVTQGYSEQGPGDAAAAAAPVTASSRNWPAQSMFKLHVLVGDTPQWVYRQVVGHEGEGDQSLLVYRTPEGRVMRMPHDQIDAAAGFGAAISPDELTGGAAPGEEPVPTFEPSPTPPPQPTQAPGPTPANMGEAVAPTARGPVNPDQEKLNKDAGFAKALTVYQQSKNEKDWDLVRREAERVTNKRGPDLDAMLAPFSDVAQGGGKQAVYGGMEGVDDVMPPVIDEDEVIDEREKATRQMKGRKIKEPTHMRALAKKAGVGMDRAMKAWGEAQFDFEKAHPDVKKKSDRYYQGVTGYMKKKIGLGSKKESTEVEADDARQAAAIEMFVADDRFHEMMNKFESTRNEGYLLRAVERASRVAGIPLHEARALVEEILEAAKK